MKKINNIGNLPAHLQLFCKALGGTLLKDSDQTEFYEVSSIKEFESNAVSSTYGGSDGNEGYEIIPTIDQSTGRGFLVGFEVSEPKHIVTLGSYVKLKIYFLERPAVEIQEWTKKISEHRTQQITDMRLRKQQIEEERHDKPRI